MSLAGLPEQTGNKHSFLASWAFSLLIPLSCAAPVLTLGLILFPT